MLSDSFVGPTTPKKRKGLSGDLGELMESIKKYPWSELQALQDKGEVVGQIEEAEKMLRNLKKVLKD